MPAVKSISLELTPEEYALLCKIYSYSGIGDYISEDEKRQLKKTRGKIEAINKRLTFASSKPEH